MLNELETTSNLEESRQAVNPTSAQSQLQALKSLTQLLMREIESLDKTADQPQVLFSHENINLSLEMERFEINLIRHAMMRAKGNQRVAAKILGTKVTTLNAKIKRFALDDYSFMGRLEGIARQKAEIHK